MAQIRIEHRRTGPIWIAAIIVAAFVVVLIVWLYARQRTAVPPVAPAAPSHSQAAGAPRAALA